jgi:hypothetical protein
MAVVPSEHAEQVALMKWARYSSAQYPELRMLYAVPNGGDRNLIVATRLKAEGVKAGVPDLCLPVPRGPYASLYVELKRQKGGQVSKEQSWWHEALREAGSMVEVCRGWSAAAKVIEDYLNQ